MAYDRPRERTVLFGGAGGVNYGDTWEWDGAVWNLRAETGPSPRHGHSLSYDSSRRRVFLFGGLANDGGIVGDTWEWDGTQWTAVAAIGPEPRREHAMAYDIARGRVVVFGGGGDSPPGVLEDTWELPSDPFIIAHPLSLTVNNGGIAIFGVRVTGAKPRGYQWRRDGIDLSDGGNVSGATSLGLAINPVMMADAGLYDVVVSNPCGTVTSDPATLTVRCPADFTDDGIVNSGDFFAFLGFFFAGNADFNEDGRTDSQDFFDFLAAFFIGCP